MENRVVTISREYGSGGRMVGRKLAEKLGIHCYDADLIQRIVDKSGYSADYVKEEGESAAGGVFSTFLADRTRGLTTQDGRQGILRDRRTLRGLHPEGKG